MTGETQIVTYRFRLKDKHSAALNAKARAVNFVWNFCNETQRHAVRWGRKWLTGYDLGKLTAGAFNELPLSATTIEAVCHQYARSRVQHRRPWLKWRGKKSLGWVPFKKGSVRTDGHALFYHGHRYVPMHWREMPEGAVILAGSFGQDTRGRWYINCPVAVPARASAAHNSVGIDLGLKEVAVLSTGERVANPAYYRQLENRLGMAQRARKWRLVKTIAAKIANCRHDYLHKASAQIALSHDLIFVGNVSSSQLARTRLAKSVKDAGWSTLRNQLRYKAVRHGGRMIEVNERMTTQVCSSCGCLPEGRPEGIAGLGIREWTCSECGTVHDRDVNAARNILRCGLASLAEGAARMRSSQHRSSWFGG